MATAFIYKIDAEMSNQKRKKEVEDIRVEKYNCEERYGARKTATGLKYIQTRS